MGKSKEKKIGGDRVYFIWHREKHIAHKGFLPETGEKRKAAKKVKEKRKKQLTKRVGDDKIAKSSARTVSSKEDLKNN